MSYKIVVESDHVYVKYFGDIDTLDIVQLTKEETFINNIRQLNHLIHDFSNCAEVNIGLEDIKNVAIMANIESNFTENLVEVIIPKDINDPQSEQRIEALSQAIKSQQWAVLLATSYSDALEQIRVTS